MRAMLDQLVQAFTQSTQGQTALSRLQAQGFPPQQAQSFLQAALPSAAQAMHGAQASGAMGANGPQGLLDVQNSHYGTNFLSGAVSSLLRGQGLMGAAVDGLQGVVGGHVAEVIAQRFGLPPRVAGTIGAIVTPLAIDFLWERMRGGQLNLGSLFGAGGAQGSPPAPRWGGGAPQPPQAGFGAGAPAGATLPGGLGALAGLLGGGPQGPSVPGGLAGLLGGSQQGPVSPTVQGGLGAVFGNLFRGQP
jgi:hypothetical protein